MSRTSNRVDPELELEPDRAEFPPLTRVQVRELERRLRDSKDRRRYLLATALSAKHPLFYNVSEDTFAMDDPTRGTLFKRRPAVEAIRALLSGGVRILQCRVSSRGRLILRSVPRVRAEWQRIPRSSNGT